MTTAMSLDGSPIFFSTVGDGPPVVIVGGAMSTATAGVPLADALAAAGFQGVTMDRRARGASGDTAPYAPEREAEDVAAVIRAVGGEAAVLGHSSGAVLALFAAGAGAPITHLFLSEPPFSFGEKAADPGLPHRLQTCVDEGRPEDAITMFQRDAVGLPEPMIEQIRQSPMFADLVPLAQSAVYDAILTNALPRPTPAMAGIAVPVTILRGEPTFPILVRASELLAEAMPEAELVVVPESRDHGVDPVGTVREIAARMG
ncbi:alpha/beta fold hydrolase [Microbacterium sp. G2-8]|uniref:alpha/beta fold hydrolase n=1 Tax=Microbacterium sp. G2-8 TaxID=2842454 RepID=UPI001C8A5EE8|nr:alpha/beta hydrolase [Microbacterium sp. G2-8]